MTGSLAELKIGDSIELKGPLGSFVWKGDGKFSWRGRERQGQNGFMDDLVMHTCGVFSSSPSPSANSGPTEHCNHDTVDEGAAGAVSSASLEASRAVALCCRSSSDLSQGYRNVPSVRRRPE